MRDHSKDNARREVCRQLVARFDSIVTEYESRWGINVLPRLVGHELAERWALHMRELNEAIRAESNKDLQDLVDGAARGFELMEKQAIETGHKPHDPEYWSVALEDGRELRVYKTDIDAAQTKGEGVVAYSLQEIARVVSGLSVVNDVKENLGGTVEIF
jgi:hypothetical protein